MARIGSKSTVVVLVLFVALVLASSVLVSAERSLKQVFSSDENGTIQEVDSNYFNKVLNFLRQKGQSQLGYHHAWPEMKFGWRIIVGTIIGFFGAAFGSVGGVGGGGIFVPMLTLIIGFDAKSSTAISKCMITGAAAATVYYNLKLRHPTLDLPIIDYDLALLFQPMLVLGISIGVTFNVIFAEWMVTILLIILFLGSSTKAFFKGVETWKKETIIKKEVARLLASNGSGNVEVEYKPLLGGPVNGTQMESKESQKSVVSIVENVRWKELGMLVAVWVIILALQIAKNHMTTCSVAYWVVNLLQVLSVTNLIVRRSLHAVIIHQDECLNSITVGVSAYEAISLYKGWRVIASNGAETNWRVHQLILYCCCGILAGIVGGLLGLGGGFILGPLFLDLGIPPQVSSATASFAMMFSASMSVAEYYLLSRLPVPYALYFVAVATIAALVGQHVVRRLIAILGRASLIIFILAFTIFLSAILLGGVGISDMIKKIPEDHSGFENICAYEI
ncbi:sulfite exporter TauE/SafE family protein 3-like [Camellia sinensis]|uniref:sulfite exporter TauE/SafE family protein 3-like n=1 Tax=Camellia sinensis TaxID=4442 RepID=UPI00103573AE|nr:sulfite exporter TauE/SafE family protein 3-like [Camellia sinensis]